MLNTTACTFIFGAYTDDGSGPEKVFGVWRWGGSKLFELKIEFKDFESR
jgi:hypothetical protein